MGLLYSPVPTAFGNGLGRSGFAGAAGRSFLLLAFLLASVLAPAFSWAAAGSPAATGPLLLSVTEEPSPGLEMENDLPPLDLGGSVLADPVPQMPESQLPDFSRLLSGPTLLMSTTGPVCAFCHHGSHLPGECGEALTAGCTCGLTCPYCGDLPHDPGACLNPGCECGMTCPFCHHSPSHLPGAAGIMAAGAGMAARIARTCGICPMPVWRRIACAAGAAPAVLMTGICRVPARKSTATAAILAFIAAMTGICPGAALRIRICLACAG